MKLYIIRHGETDWNKQKKLQGQCDIPLNDFGRELAQITADALIGEHWDIIYSSPLCRALETAQILRGNRDIEIVTDERLKEISFGEDEGVESGALRKDFSNFFFAPHLYVPSKGGESILMLYNRAKSFLDDLLRQYRDTRQSVLIVAHGAFNKALMLNLHQDEIKNLWSGEFQHNCCVNQYDITADGITTIYEAKIFYEAQTTNYLKDK